jgi:hypothetical protein
LYGDTLRPFIYADLIGKTLVEKSTVSVALILTDAEAMLDLRLHLPTPAARIDVLNAEQSHEAESAGILIRKTPAGALVCHPRFPTDNSAIRTLLEQLDPKMDFTEPFTRIREALTEARKMGATSRAA